MATLPSWGDYFDISLEFWIGSYSGAFGKNGWTELLRFTATDKDTGSSGDRIPAIFAASNGNIFVVSQIGTNGNAVKDFMIKTKTWTKVEIKQYKENGKVYNINNILTLSFNCLLFLVIL